MRDGDVVEYEADAPERLEPDPEAIPLRVLYDEGDVVVVDKPAGMVVHPARGHTSGTLVHALLGLGGRWSALGGAARPGIVHRLDRGTSGLILAARSDASSACSACDRVAAVDAMDGTPTTVWLGSFSAWTDWSR